MGSKKVIHLFCLQPYSRVPSPPSAPPVLSLTSQLAQRPGHWVPCFSPESGGPAEPASWVGPSWHCCFSWERFRAPHLGGSLHFFLGSQLLLLVECSLKCHPRTFQSLRLPARRSKALWSVCLGQKLWSAVCCAGGGATTDCSPEAREPPPTCGLGGPSSSAQGKGCPTV